ncbi:MAG: hypothetical protein ABL966_05335 [Acidimicrobiales bacterium]
MDARSDQPEDAPLPSAEGLLHPGPGQGLAARLDAWLADARVEGSADARARERWLHAAATADATFGGVLVDLAERGTALSVSTTRGRRHHGRIEVIGADFVALRGPGGGEVLLALAAVASVRTAPLVETAGGERVVTTALRLTEVLAELTAERARVVIATGDGTEAVVGELRAVGYDVVTIRTDADPPGSAYVPVAAIAEVALG